MADPAPLGIAGRLAATALGAGRSPVAPGTCGTAVAAALYAGLLAAGLAEDAVVAALAGLALGAGVPLGHRACATWGVDDPGPFVLDEVAGYFIALLFLPHGPAALIGAFVLFRLFDVAKPPPIGTIEKLPGGWGIMLDDVAAGVMANLCLQLLFGVGLLRVHGCS